MKLSSTLGPRGPKVPYCRRTFGRDQGGWDGSAALGRWRAGKNADSSQNAVFYNVLGWPRDGSRMAPGWLPDDSRMAPGWLPDGSHGG